MHETVWLGRGGQGAFTAARLQGLAAVRFAGKQALAFPSFGPERRGAPVFAFTRIADAPIRDRSTIKAADAAIIMDETLLTPTLTGFIQPKTLLIVDSESDQAIDTPARLVRVPARRIAREILGSDHTNTILLGVLVGLSGVLPAESVTAGIAAEFGQGSRASKNVAAFLHAYQLGQELAHG